jgi:hypothetical protein
MACQTAPAPPLKELTMEAQRHGETLTLFLLKILSVAPCLRGGNWFDDPHKIERPETGFSALLRPICC